MLPSEKYWRRDIRTQDQKFYTSFSLLGIAFTNYLTGHRLSEGTASSWGNVAYYYSIVYSVRELLFLAVGDFPRGHNQLAKALYADRQRYRNREGEIRWTYRYNWLTTFLSKEIREEFRINESTEINNELIINRLNRYSKKIIELALLIEMGKKLDKARVTRNVENYDSLVIYHHIDHVRITPIVERLRKELKRVAKLYLTKAIKIFTEYVKKDLRREYYLSFLNAKVKLTGKDAVRTTMNEYRLSTYYPEIEEIFYNYGLITDEINLDFSSEVFNNITMDSFDPKTDLMNKFDRKVNRFIQD